MAARSESFKIRLSIEELADYNARAHAVGMDVSAWIRMKCFDPDAPATPPESFKSRRTPSYPIDGGTPKSLRWQPETPTRKEMCVHRRRPDQFCNRCD